MRGDALLGCLGSRVPACRMCVSEGEQGSACGWRHIERTATRGSSSGKVHSQPPSFTSRQYCHVMFFSEHDGQPQAHACPAARVWHLGEPPLFALCPHCTHARCDAVFSTKYARIRHLPLHYILHGRTPECRRLLKRSGHAPPRRPLMPTHLDRHTAKPASQAPSHGAGKACMHPRGCLHRAS